MGMTTIPTAGAVDVTSSLAVDARALSALKREASKDPKQAARAAAGQFEAFLVTQLLKTARAARLAETPDNTASGQMMGSMFDEQVAQAISKTHAFGLADLLTQQILRQSGTSANPPAAAKQ